MVGDQFLRDIYPSLQAIRAKTTLDKAVKPYLFEYYNVIPRYAAMNSNIHPMLARVFNEIVTALNERTQLQRYIIIILDKEILEAADHNNFGIQRIISEMLDWLMHNIDKTIDLRREDVRLKRAGAIASSGEPCIIWTKMTTRPIIQDATKSFLFAECRKLNEIMDEIIPKYKHTHLMEVQVPSDDMRLFDKWGNLSGVGHEKYWGNFILQIKQFDRAETDLRPPSTRKMTTPKNQGKRPSNS